MQSSTLTKCLDCGLRFLAPQPSDAELDKVYSPTYFLGEQTTEGRERFAALKRATASVYLATLRQSIPQCGGRLLEIGCGVGDFLALAAEAGFDVEGVEISPHAATEANHRLGHVRVKVGTLETADFVNGSYDVVAMFDVLEHVRNPLAFLERVHRLLKPEGILFVVTPSLDSWSGRLLGRHWMEYKQEHLYYFSRRTLQAALMAASFHVCHMVPNVKYLSLDYVARHFERYPVPVLSAIVGAIRSVAPARLAHHPIRLVASGMAVVAISK